MTTEKINWYKDWLTYKKEQFHKAYLSSHNEHYNDSYVILDDLLDICELAKCQLYDNELRKKGGSKCTE